MLSTKKLWLIVDEIPIDKMNACVLYTELMNRIDYGERVP